MDGYRPRWEWQVTWHGTGDQELPLRQGRPSLLRCTWMGHASDVRSVVALGKKRRPSDFSFQSPVLDLATPVLLAADSIMPDRARTTTIDSVTKERPDVDL